MLLYILQAILLIAFMFLTSALLHILAFTIIRNIRIKRMEVDNADRKK